METSQLVPPSTEQRIAEHYSVPHHGSRGFELPSTGTVHQKAYCEEGSGISRSPTQFWGGK